MGRGGPGLRARAAAAGRAARPARRVVADRQPIGGSQSRRLSDTAAATDDQSRVRRCGTAFRAAVARSASRSSPAHYNIGAWAWELPQFPEAWYNRFAYYDEIWVGTSFIASALAPIAPVPVVRVPPVDHRSTGSRDAGRRGSASATHEFVFAFMLRRAQPPAAKESRRPPSKRSAARFPAPVGVAWC